MINVYREVLCLILGLAWGLLIGFFVYPIMYHRYLRKEGLLKERDALVSRGEE